MTEQHDRDELVELMSRYANMADTKSWDELARLVLCDEVTCDFSSLGAPLTTLSREDWCRGTKQAFAGWTATHHAITNHVIAVDGDRASIRAHVRAEHWAPATVAAGGPSCWLVVGFYDNVAVRTPDGWRLSTVKLTAIHQENESLLASQVQASEASKRD
jgi:SnoaL-like domain